MNRSQRILIPFATGIVLMAMVLFGGFAIFGNGPLWNVWPYVSIGFGLWVAFSMYAVIYAHASAAPAEAACKTTTM